MTYHRMTMVITTINVPRLLEDYARNFEKFGHLHEVSALIVGDRKTPHGAVADLSANLRMTGFDARYVDLEEQDRYLDRFPRMKPLIPFNSDNRRNIGYLMAAEGGAEIIVAVDDDNFVGDDDWYDGHALVGSTMQLKTVSSSNGWFNPCRLMDMDSPVPTYARGYPYAKRHLADEDSYAITEGRVVLNGGMWLGDPDVDSLTRLSQPARALRVNEERLMLAPGTWAPINTQNTAFHRDILPAFYFVPVGDPVCGIAVERYGDIWAGFFARKLIDHFDDRITFGRPACDHRRNVHNLLGDLELEFWSVILTDPLAEFLRGWSLTASSYGDAYLELADHLEAAEWPHKRMAGEFKAFFTKMARAMRVWVETCRELG
ncbi:MAG: hypothetical protein ACLQGP_03815 [Isosphaeraceae bacterium]